MQDKDKFGDIGALLFELQATVTKLLLLYLGFQCLDGNFKQTNLVYFEIPH